MPEGPELRYLREQLKQIKGKYINNITSYSKQKVTLPNKSKINGIYTKGKLLYIETEHYYMHIHLMLTGWIYLDDEPKHTKYIIHLDKNDIYVQSKRKFTKIEILGKKEHIKRLGKLGTDILTEKYTYKAFYNLIKSKKMMVSKFLMDQDKLCGIGNYIKNEALYLAKIHPKHNTGNLSDKQIKDLYRTIKLVSFSVLYNHLKESSLAIPKDIQNIKPKKIVVPYYYHVYSQEKDKKGNKITKEKIAGRDTYYVKKVQKII